MRKKVKKVIDKSMLIKLRIDHRTIITVRTKEALKSWLLKFPQAKVISQ